MSYPSILVLIEEQREGGNFRVFYNYATKASAIEGLLEYYEESLKSTLIPSNEQPTFSYTFADLIAYFESLPELIILACKTESRGYIPHRFGWIKPKMHEYLADQIGKEMKSLN